jgi:hypothetical protein
MKEDSLSPVVLQNSAIKEIKCPTLTPQMIVLIYGYRSPAGASYEAGNTQ